MQILVTGAPGFIGSRVVDLLLAEGHEVVGLARSDARAETLKAKGVTPLVADLRSSDVIAKAAAQTDATVHLGYIHDFDKYHESLPVELKLIAAILEALKGSNKPFIGTSGTGMLPETSSPADESTPVDQVHRAKAEALMIEGAMSGVKTAMIRLPPYVYAQDGAAFSRIQEGKAKEQGVASYIGEGTNQSPSVYVEDAAKAYVLALQHAKPGGIYHVANGLTTHKQMMEAIATKHDLKAHSVSKEEAAQLYGPFLASIFGKNNLPDCSKAKSELHWSAKYGSDYFLQCVAGKA